jgi:formylglycine-generating enzyme required for sulfatase activity
MRKLPFFFACLVFIVSNSAFGKPRAKKEKQLEKHGVLALPKGQHLDLVLVPAGEFMMGSAKTEPGHIDNETQRLTKISRAFYLGTTEVTQEQFEAVMGMNPATREHRYQEAANVGANKPVVGVTFEEAQSFCLKLSQLTKRAVRLPTEAEWEMACKGGGAAAGTGPFSPGVTQENLSDFAWYGKKARVSDDVALKKPTNLGLFDLHGNVWEWTSDWFAPYDLDQTVDPQGPKQSSNVRVFRGGCSFNPLPLQRCAFRHTVSPEYKDAAIGFRVLVER